MPVALIDWEFAGPAEPLVELAQTCWLNAKLPTTSSPSCHPRSVFRGSGLARFGHQASGRVVGWRAVVAYLRAEDPVGWQAIGRSPDQFVGHGVPARRGDRVVAGMLLGADGVGVVLRSPVPGTAPEISSAAASLRPGGETGRVSAGKISGVTAGRSIQVSQSARRLLGPPSDLVQPA